MKVNNIKYTETKKIVDENGKKIKVEMTVKVNNSPERAGVFYVQCRYGSGYVALKRLCEYFPEYAEILMLDGRDIYGRRSYFVQNFVYYIEQAKMSDDELCSLYNVNQNQLAILKVAAPNKECFAYFLVKLGIISKWREEADRALQWLTEKTGMELIQYEHEPKCDDQYITTEAIEIAKKRHESGGFQIDNLIKQELEKQQNKLQDAKAEAIRDFQKKVNEATAELDCKMWALEHIGVGNYWVYVYSYNLGKITKKLKLNGTSAQKRYTEEEIKAIMEIPNSPFDSIEVKE